MKDAQLRIYCESEEGSQECTDSTRALSEFVLDIVSEWFERGRPPVWDVDAVVSRCLDQLRLKKQKLLRYLDRNPGKERGKYFVEGEAEYARHEDAKARYRWDSFKKRLEGAADDKGLREPEEGLSPSDIRKLALDWLRPQDPRARKTRAHLFIHLLVPFIQFQRKPLVEIPDLARAMGFKQPHQARKHLLVLRDMLWCHEQQPSWSKEGHDPANLAYLHEVLIEGEFPNGWIEGNEIRSQPRWGKRHPPWARVTIRIVTASGRKFDGAVTDWTEFGLGIRLDPKPDNPISGAVCKQVTLSGPDGKRLESMRGVIVWADSGQAGLSLSPGSLPPEYLEWLERN